ncbi:DNA polymerase I [Thioalkalivibrio sulfidiphilus HL-EbGr7]|uniref:DNA polymerase I n=1 Tax=Thioalkalivibrio sulfidiphilus (strain HL-EbGR7) TaxID=396588 RepID=B8GTD1_THISH|nr:DNA polymerase I [Thioalkalivibrio sulfidiphilus]ACL71191.1 DNA polymerase I [Thioalkalivibrio sulfidiphilus HL-EbGr7]
MSKTPPLVLVDGSSYLYRAFHALPPLTNSRGEPTGAVYGVANMLRKLLKDYAPEHVVVVFDAKGKTFRDEMYAEYKANRPPMPDELAAQVEPLHQVVQAMGLPMLVVPGVEADDVIATLAREGREHGLEVVISTGDKDMAQLVEPGVTLVNTMTDTKMDAEGVKEKFGVAPEQIVDYLALIGDTVDNVPGVDKVGPKTAVKWLEAYGSLDGIMEHAEEIKGKVGENLRAALGHLPLSRELVTVRRDLELDVTPESLRLGEPDRETLRALFSRLEFRTWLKELESGEEQAQAASDDPTPGQPAQAYETILDEKALAAWMKRLETAELFAFDTETTSLDYMQAQVVGVSFAVKTGEAAYLPLAHDYADAPQQLDRDETLKRLKPLLESARHKKLGHHLKYDRNVLLNHGIELNGIEHDTMLESYVLNSTASRHDMDSLAQKYLDYRTTHYEEVAGKGAKQIPFSQVRIEDATPYAAEDADITLRLHEHLWPQLSAAEGQCRVYREIEMPLVPVLSRMERTGVKVDAERLFAQSHELAERMGQIEREAHEVAGGAFNLGSPKQIQEILYERQKLPVLRKTPKGQPSTAEDVLEQLALDYPLPKLILEHRSLSKLKSTYTDKLPERIDPDTGRVHTSYHQAVASTGRLSSSDPNLQNIPIRTEEGRRIRQAFVAPSGRRLVAADYSQIELRIMAHLSGDAGLLRAFAEGQDIHRATAAEVFGVGLDQVSGEQRRAAKAINFGLIYGMSAFGLARQLGIERGDAQDYVDRYFARYPGVKDYMESTREKARDLGYVETLFGRRLYLPDINARNGQIRAQAERVAINAPMQGTAADIIKRAMIQVDQWIRESRIPAVMILQVHDELVLEVDEDAVDKVREELCVRMSQAAELKVPLVVEAGVGDNWDDAH